METIRDTHLSEMYRELPSLFKVKAETDQSAIIQCGSPFTLGLVIGFVMNRWTRYGISFNRLEIDTKQMTIKLQVLRNHNLNAMQVLWV